jgi:hypothetical protein
MRHLYCPRLRNSTRVQCYKRLHLFYCGPANFFIDESLGLNFTHWNRLVFSFDGCAGLVVSAAVMTVFIATTSHDQTQCDQMN